LQKRLEIFSLSHSKKSDMREGQNKGAVFVSHAAEDKNIAERVINTLARGLSLRIDCFFYTSELSIGVPSGREFFSYIRESICGAKPVIRWFLLHFLRSQFCLAESGATWALRKDWTILMFPGVAPSDLASFLKELQAAKITGKDALSELAGRLAAATGAEARKDALEWARWESERDDFIMDYYLIAR
jgi:hypothetical protein